MRAFSLTSVQGIQSYLEVVLARQKLLQSSKVKDVPQHVSVGLHRVYDFHCTNQKQNSIHHQGKRMLTKYINTLTIRLSQRIKTICVIVPAKNISGQSYN